MLCLQGLFEFLKLHPKLEFLSVMDSIETKQEKLPSNFFARVASNCRLLKMHKLVYWINSSLRGRFWNEKLLLPD